MITVRDSTANRIPTGGAWTYIKGNPCTSKMLYIDTRVRERWKGNGRESGKWKRRVRKRKGEKKGRNRERKRKSDNSP
jgi:hypothetical protein